ncbi:unnamed protein product [Heligmosomoides polygyrus]|uniref:Uncharacterized protein n=1 Tax=Heligmosomoides polygyrus TaxID=6339 RepID=A0A183FJ14_HELPZ|nr:unnamed protein product [Heligmosomoides polygyrus]
MLTVAIDKASSAVADGIEEEKRSRSLVVSGVSEPDSEHLPPSLQRAELREKVTNLLDALKVDCEPVEVFRMERADSSRPRLVKIVLPTRSHWGTALANARLLRAAPGFSHVFVRRSMTGDERKRECELRQAARERNKG